jgi:hypothetical protein
LASRQDSRFMSPNNCQRRCRTGRRKSLPSSASLILSRAPKRFSVLDPSQPLRRDMIGVAPACCFPLLDPRAALSAAELRTA